LEVDQRGRIRLSMEAVADEEGAAWASSYVLRKKRPSVSLFCDSGGDSTLPK
jgi:hypothetical protein